MSNEYAIVQYQEDDVAGYTALSAKAIKDRYPDEEIEIYSTWVYQALSLCEIQQVRVLTTVDGQPLVIGSKVYQDTNKVTCWAGDSVDYRLVGIVGVVVAIGTEGVLMAFWEDMLEDCENKGVGKVQNFWLEI
jgi:hypothetical protein